MDWVTARLTPLIAAISARPLRRNWRFGSFARFRKTTPICPGLSGSYANCKKTLPSARSWPSRSRAEAAINIPPAGFCRCCANCATVLARYLYLTKFTPALAARENGCLRAQRTMPDIISLGKALTGDFPCPPASARDVMDAPGRAPPAKPSTPAPTSAIRRCAMALAQIKEIQTRRLASAAPRWADSS